MPNRPNYAGRKPAPTPIEEALGRWLSCISPDAVGKLRMVDAFAAGWEMGRLDAEKRNGNAG